MLRATYHCGQSLIPIVNKGKQNSPTWKAIAAVWEGFIKGVGKKLNDGKGTNFWWDLWSPLDRPLIEFVVSNQHEINQEASVASMTLPTRGWNVLAWRRFLPQWVIQKLIHIQPPRNSSCDEFCWRNGSDGRFSVQAAYNFLNQQHRDVQKDIWGRVWRWQLPEKIKFFLWQASHESIMTNALRVRRRLSDSSQCPLSCAQVESIIHTLRDCSRARQLWRKLLAPQHYNSFFSCSIQDWMTWNATHQPQRPKLKCWPWQMVFGLSCWLIWKARCNEVLNGIRITTNGLYHQLRTGLAEECVQR